MNVFPRSSCVENLVLKITCQWHSETEPSGGDLGQRKPWGWRPHDGRWCWGRKASWDVQVSRTESHMNPNPLHIPQPQVLWYCNSKQSTAWMHGVEETAWHLAQVYKWMLLFWGFVGTIVQFLRTLQPFKDSWLFPWCMAWPLLGSTSLPEFLLPYFTLRHPPPASSFLEHTSHKLLATPRLRYVSAALQMASTHSFLSFAAWACIYWPPVTGLARATRRARSESSASLELIICFIMLWVRSEWGQSDFPWLNPGLMVHLRVSSRAGLRQILSWSFSAIITE